MKVVDPSAIIVCQYGGAEPQVEAAESQPGDGEAGLGDLVPRDHRVEGPVVRQGLVEEGIARVELFEVRVRARDREEEDGEGARILKADLLRGRRQLPGGQLRHGAAPVPGHETQLVVYGRIAGPHQHRCEGIEAETEVIPIRRAHRLVA